MVEEFAVGDLIYPRDEWNADAPMEVKLVEEVFVRYAGILALHAGGQVIRTTGEHPFYVKGNGWTACNRLNVGDMIRTEDGWVPVEEVWDTGDWEVVYNARVSDHHTYFVGEEGWGWSVWAHNAYMKGADQRYSDEGKSYIQRALFWRDSLPVENFGGVTVAVSKWDNQEIVCLYANQGNIGDQVPLSVINAFESRVQADGGIFIWGFGVNHAEKSLHILYPTVHTIGITHFGGPCKEICLPYFARNSYHNIWYPPV